MFTISDCITRINQILNYPALAYVDISHFFDQAISELNTTFKIGIPLVSTMVDENRININELPNLTLLNIQPSGNYSEIPAEKVDENSDTSKIYFDTSDGLFYKYNNITELWTAHSKIYGLFINDSHQRILYETVPLAMSGYAIWSPVDESRFNNFDLNIYLPTDWIILFIIPYVCFKASVRDGGNGALYNEEYIQGFQQLQTSYDVPNSVLLSDVAHLPAYTAVVKRNITALHSRIPTRAVYDSMKIGNAILPIYGGFNSRGGWGL